MDNWPGLKVKLSKTQRKQQAENALRKLNTIRTPPAFAPLSATPTWSAPVMGERSFASSGWTGGGMAERSQAGSRWASDRMGEHLHAGSGWTSGGMGEQSHAGSGWSGHVMGDQSYAGSGWNESGQWDQPSLRTDSSWPSFSALASSDSAHSGPFGGPDQNNVSHKEPFTNEDQIDDYLYSGAPDTAETMPGDPYGYGSEPPQSVSEDQIEAYLYSDAPDATEKLHAVASGVPVHETLSKDEVDDYLYSDGPVVARQPAPPQSKQPESITKPVPSAQPVNQGTTDQQDFFCYVCNVHCHNTKYYKKHMAGIRHRRNLDAQREATAKFYQYTCKVCDLDLQSQKNYDIHMGCKKHLAKVAEHEKEQKNTKNSHNNYRCRLCDVDCTDYKGYHQHLQDKNHSSQEKVYSARFPPDIYRCSVCSVNCNTAEAFHYHLIDADHKRKEAESGVPYTVSPLVYICRVCFAECGNKQGYSDHSKTDEHKVKNRAKHRGTPPPEKKTTDKKEKVYLPVNPQYMIENRVYCDVCDLYCQNSKNYKFHIAGPHHEKKVEEKAIRKLHAQQNEAEPGSRKSHDVRMHCEVCNIYCADIQTYKSHVAKAKHREKVAELSGVKYQKKADDDMEDAGVDISMDPTKNPALDPKTLYLKGVNLGIKQPELKRLMPKASAVFIPPEYRKDSFKDLCVSCYATFGTEGDAEKAMLFLNGTSFCGQKLVVTYAKKLDLINMVSSLSKGKPGAGDRKRTATTSSASETGPTPPKQPALPPTTSTAPSSGINTDQDQFHLDQQSVPVSFYQTDGISLGAGSSGGPPEHNLPPQPTGVLQPHGVGVKTPTRLEAPPFMVGQPNAPPGYSGAPNIPASGYGLPNAYHDNGRVPNIPPRGYGLPNAHPVRFGMPNLPNGPPVSFGMPNLQNGPPCQFGAPNLAPGGYALPTGPPGGLGPPHWQKPPAGTVHAPPSLGTSQEPWDPDMVHSIPRVYGPNRMKGNFMVTIHGFSLGVSERKLWCKLEGIVQLDMLPDFRSTLYGRRYCMAFAHFPTEAAADSVIEKVDKRAFAGHPISVQYTEPDDEAMLRKTREGPTDEDRNNFMLWVYAHILQCNMDQFQQEHLSDASSVEAPAGLSFKPDHSKDMSYAFAKYSNEGQAAAALARLNASSFNGRPIRAGYCFKFIQVRKVKKGKRRK